MEKQQAKVKRFSRWIVISFVLNLPLMSIFDVGNALAQSEPSPIEIPSSWNPVGSGARALGMGGAFIAVADDATAASWNPGGLIQLETPEISMVGSSFYRHEENFFGTNPEASGSQSISADELNYLSLTYPFSLFNRNMICTLTYQNLYDFNREAEFILSQNEGNFFYDRNIDINHEGNLSAIGLSYGISLTPTFSIGITLNFWEDWLENHGWESTTRESGTIAWIDDPFWGSGNYSYTGVEKKEYSFSGLNANLGFLWRLTSKLTMGGVVKTPFTADLDTKTTLSYSGAISSVDREDADLDMPLSYGIGFSYRFSDAFSVAADIYRTEWQDFLLKDSSGETSPITGLSEKESDIDPTTQVRLGCEYLFIGPQYVIPVRGGIFYDPAPAPDSPDDYYGVSIGTGIAWKRYVFDVAYQYRWGNDVGDYLYRGYDFSMDSEEHRIYTSLIIHF